MIDAFGFMIEKPVETESKIENANRRRFEKSEIHFGPIDAALVGMTVIWGLNFVVVKATFDEIAPFAFVAVRFAIAAILLILIVRVRQGGFVIPRRDWGRVALLGIIGTTIYQPLYISGLALTKASNSALILATTPAFIVLLNRFLLGERFMARGWLGIVLAFAGILLIVLSSGDLATDSSALRGDAIILAATMCWSFYSVLAAPLLKRYSSLALTALSTIWGTLPLVILCTPALLTQPWAKVSVGAWSGLLYSATFGIVIAYMIWNFGVQRIGGARTAIYNNLTPVVAALAAVVFLNESLSLLKIAGAVGIFGGLFLARTAHVVVEPEA
jgi:drug/metabolite transporter (DMT)-like permease